MSAVVKVFDTLATENAVAGVTGRFDLTSASPEAPSHAEPSAKTIATETPGLPAFARHRSRCAWRSAIRAVDAVGAFAGGVSDPPGPGLAIAPSLASGRPAVDGRAVAAPGATDGFAEVSAEAAGAAWTAAAGSV